MTLRVYSNASFRQIQRRLYVLCSVQHRLASLSPTAEQQSNFCDLALSLLQQAATPNIHLNATCLIPESPQPHQHRPTPSYALVQHLPAGDWWSSLASVSDPVIIQPANAEVVAILPTPSSSNDTPVPTLGSYFTKPFTLKKPVNSSRWLTAGSFLDYGLYSSFAPSFDQDGEDIGRRKLGEVLWYRKEKISMRKALALATTPSETIDPALITPPSPAEQNTTAEPDHQLELEGLLPPEEVELLKSTLRDLELEKAIQKLLDHNQKALSRLEQLQIQRLTKHPTSQAEEGSEEWDTAHAILDSLTILAAFRPRTANDKTPSLIPSPAVMHKLHKTLALEPSQGWYGTLPPNRTNVLRDDSTVKIKPGGTTAVAPAVTTVSTPTTTATPTAANSFSNYPYTTPQQGAYRQTQTQYAFKTTQPAAYYNYIPTSMPTQQAYYGQQSYATGTTNQQPYGSGALQQSFSGYSWYNGQYGNVQSNAGSGRGTPQPATGGSVASPVPTNYTNFFNNPAGVAVQTPRTPAVANTVVGNAVNGTTIPQQTVPTLPVHLRATNSGTYNYQTPS
ncbi:hypothetical protein CVT24_003546 [Panaeolus cyanescens]|uniref:Uncharacterized protein n=1 Tax=Panaeolus cyanescens TaxID=181874 RepID=A0A409Y768_9AGAR|nr:hypothetical protein CVT24_003546 [Panaeolus cyanescens]